MTGFDKKVLFKTGEVRNSRYLIKKSRDKQMPKTIINQLMLMHKLI